MPCRVGSRRPELDVLADALGRKTYPGSDEGEDIRDGFDPGEIKPSIDDPALDEPQSSEGSSGANNGQHRRRESSSSDKEMHQGNTARESHSGENLSYKGVDEERRVWGSSDGAEGKDGRGSGERSG